MPGYDRTGPAGAGPMTGRARGVCNASRRDALPVGGAYGRGFGFRRGGMGSGRMGAGWGRAYSPAAFAPPVVEPAQELAYLKQQASDMSNALDAINQRIETLDTDKTPSKSE